jgi:hypothetical protein
LRPPRSIGDSLRKPRPPIFIQIAAGFSPRLSRYISKRIVSSLACVSLA